MTVDATAAEAARGAAGQSRGNALVRLRLALGFFSVLPLGRTASLTEVAAAAAMLPLVGAILGGLEGAAGWGALTLFGPQAGAAIVLAAALLVTGMHHADGLADVGDAVMVHGDAGRRIAVLKDRTLGAGAAGALLMTYLVSWTALAGLMAMAGGVTIVWLLLAAEVSARLGLVLTAAASRPSHEGSGSAFIKALKGRRAAAATAAAALLLALLAWPLGAAAAAAAAAAAPLTALFLSLLARRLFGGAGGDVLGAAVELTRMAALLALLAVMAHSL